MAKRKKIRHNSPATPGTEDFGERARQRRMRIHADQAYASKPKIQFGKPIRVEDEPKGGDPLLTASARKKRKKKQTGLALLPLLLLLPLSSRADTCDPLTFYTVATIDPASPSFMSDPVDDSADGVMMYVREKGLTNWTAVADIPCEWHDTWGLGDPAGFVYHCTLGQTGVPAIRHFEPSYGIVYEWAFTAYNSAGESAMSNIVETCGSLICDPLLDPTACHDDATRTTW